LVVVVLEKEVVLVLTQEVVFDDRVWLVQAVWLEEEEEELVGMV